jgi:hypothetical protein
MYIMVGNFVYGLQLFLPNWLLPLAQHPTLPKASRLVIFHTRDLLQHNPRRGKIGKSPNFDHAYNSCRILSRSSHKSSCNVVPISLSPLHCKGILQIRQACWANWKISRHIIPDTKLAICRVPNIQFNLLASFGMELSLSWENQTILPWLACTTHVSLNTWSWWAREAGEITSLWFIKRFSRLKTGFFSWNTKVFGGRIWVPWIWNRAGAMPTARTGNSSLLMGVIPCWSISHLSDKPFTSRLPLIVRLDLGTSRLYMADPDIASTTFTRFYKHWVHSEISDNYK